MPRLEERDLLEPLFDADMREMQREHPQRAAGVRIRPSSAAFCVLSGRTTLRIGSRCSRDHRIGKRDSSMVPNWRRRLTTRPSAPRGAGVHVEGRAVDHVVVRQQPRQDLGLVVLVAACHSALDLLQRDHVGVGDDLGDALEIIAPVGAEAVLDIVADEFHEAPVAKGISLVGAAAQPVGGPLLPVPRGEGARRADEGQRVRRRKNSALRQLGE